MKQSREGREFSLFSICKRGYSRMMRWALDGRLLPSEALASHCLLSWLSHVVCVRHRAAPCRPYALDTRALAQ